MKINLIGLACIALLVASCEPVPHYNRLSVASYVGQPTEVPIEKQGKVKPYGSVKLFQNKDEVSGKYKVLALMTVEGDAGEEARFLTAMLYRAADLGADGLVLIPASGQPPLINNQVTLNVGGWGWMNSNNSHGVYRAEAIRFEGAEGK